MFQVLTTEGTVLGYVDNPIYIKKSSNGSFIQCDEGEALGISFKSTPYHLVSAEALEGSVEGVDVTIIKVDGGEVSFNNESSINDITDQLIAIQELEIERELDETLDGLEGIDDVII